MRVQERLYFTEDECEVVNEHDRRGRRLLAKRGDEIPDELAIKYGLMPAAVVKSAKKPENKAMPAPPDKMVEEVPDKAEGIVAQPETRRTKKTEKAE
jgi:hypothetical protein